MKLIKQINTYKKGLNLLLKGIDLIMCSLNEMLRAGVFTNVNICWFFRCKKYININNDNMY